MSEVASLPVLSRAHRESHDGRLPSFARETLRYLREHPEAQDTLEGIMVWWVSERAIKHWLPKARKALAALVAKGYVAKHTGADGRSCYCSQARRGSGSQKRSRNPWQ